MILADYKINIKLKLALLWAALMSLYIYADYFNLMVPGKLKQMMDSQTPVGPTTPGLLITFSLLLIVPAIMIVLSIFLQPFINKWLNILFGLLYSIISILIIISGMGDSWETFFVLYNVIELIVLSTIIWQSWKWPVASVNGIDL